MPTTPPAPLIDIDRDGERRRTKSPGCDAVADRDNAEGDRIGVPGAIGHRFGTRASANTSGPDFDRGLGPCEIADLKIRTERRKLVSSAGPVFKRANSSNSDPAV
jgi:hypothetical protein